MSTLDKSEVLVSVIMPVFNGSKYIRESIQSILDQSFRHFEFLILNDGSTDDSVEIIKSYRDSRIRLLSSDENKGLVFQLNLGVQNGRGKYLARMDADDIAHPKRIQKQFEYMEANPHVGVCGSNTRSFKNDKKYFRSILPKEHDEIRSYLLFGNPMVHPSIMIRKSVLQEHGISYSKGTDTSEDFALYVDLFDKTQFHNLQDVLLQYRLHQSNVSKTDPTQKTKARDKRIVLLSRFFQNHSEEQIQKYTHEHLKICETRMASGADVQNFVDWINFLATENRNSGLFKEAALLTASAHYLYRKLISDRMNNVTTLSILIFKYTKVFWALPPTYKILLITRCLITR